MKTIFALGSLFLAVSGQTVSDNTERKMDKICYKGIDRFQKGASNTWLTFKNAMQASTQWEDPEFKADQSSLFWQGTGDKSDVAVLKKNVVDWQRPNQLQKDKPSLWGSLGKPAPQGIIQNSLGDCWFISAAAAISENPQLILSNTPTRKYNNNGIFRWRFWVMNKWYYINIDDRLPVERSQGRLRPFSAQASKNGAWWMPLLEKAYAKLDQNYERIIAGFGIEGLRTLTGKPTTQINHNHGKEMDKVWNTLIKYTQKNYPMVAGCCLNTTNLEGLVNNHAYTLLDLLKLSNGVKIAKVRNPWNAETYKGPWSDKSSLWTDKLKKEVNMVDADNGIFYMPYEKYITTFWQTAFSMTKSWTHQQSSLRQSKKSGFYYFHNPIDQELFINIDTYSNRNYPRTCKPGTNAFAMLYSKDWQTRVGTYDWISSYGFAFLGDLDQKFLPKGDYQIYFVNKKQGTPVDATINFYSDKGIQMPNSK